MSYKWTKANVLANDGTSVIVQFHSKNWPAAGSEVLITRKNSRSLGQLRIYWRMLNNVSDAYPERWFDATAVHNWLKIQNGLYDLIEVEGVTLCLLHSTDFASMEQKRFTEYFTLCKMVLGIELNLEPEELL